MIEEEQTESEPLIEPAKENQSLVTEDTDVTDETINSEIESEQESKPKSRNQNSKARLRRKLHESELRNQQIADQLAKQSEHFSTLETKLDSVINPPAIRPDRIDFDTEEGYEDALYDWRQPAKKETTTNPPVQASAAQQNYVPEDTRENWLDQIDLAKEKYNDFDEKLKSIPAQNMTDAMTIAIMESEDAGEIAYFLGNNLPEAERIAQLNLSAQVREIDKLGNKFQSATSKAPAPIIPTTGSDAPPGDVSKMSMKDYAAYMNKKEYGG